ncbi:sugar phosphate isomerase/epimerase family protein [Arthrobacter crystallopoietes]|uniref:Sugar phosphate isomerase/epimerase n=1 Tax=Crystallibacter crystallopoietes TaxID=37928 RepID=A0A1H1CZ52_9MICC|nr:TIM barrel protein [Arthrobacter crystallopoietes]AUI50546.1 xylose isomerase [Arthrobacter crystallopoietes]SDQ69178.1 Sugar phosphate isomerase/epimerase [Arthrobacter crystallopoietes]
MSATTVRPPLGIAQLSLLGTAPPDLVRLAAGAGFDFIGTRVRPVTGNERAFDLQPGSPMLAETLARMADTGVVIRDIEFLLLDGSDQRDAWLRMMEAGQALGATGLTVAASDPDRSRLADTLARMAEDGRGHGITPTLEPISYQAVNSIPAAAALARAAGCQIVVDTLHFRRFGGTLEDLAENADLVPMVQLCDGPAQRPTDREGMVLESRSERGVPGEGDFRLPEIVAALPPELPVSVETPSNSTVSRIGEAAWVRLLKEAADRVLDEAAALRVPTSA